MANYLVGIFDSSDKAADAIEALIPKYNERISFIGLDLENEEALERIDDGNIDSNQFRTPYFGTVSGTIGPVFGSVISLEVSGLGRLSLGGDIGDALSVSPPLVSKSSGDLKASLIDVGFDEKIANDYAAFIIDGRIILFIKINTNTDYKAESVLQNYGVLDTEYTKNNLIE